MRCSIGRRPWLRVWERNVALEMEPLATRDSIGLVGALGSLCVVSCGGVMFYGSAWSRRYDAIGWVGLAAIGAGALSFALIMWLLQPHKAARHATHRLRHHVRRLRSAADRDDPAHMSEAQFDALEDEVDRAGAAEREGR